MYRDQIIALLNIYIGQQVFITADVLYSPVITKVFTSSNPDFIHIRSAHNTDVINIKDIKKIQVINTIFNAENDGKEPLCRPGEDIDNKKPTK